MEFENKHLTLTYPGFTYVKNSGTSKLHTLSAQPALSSGRKVQCQPRWLTGRLACWKDYSSSNKCSKSRASSCIAPQSHRGLIALKMHFYNMEICMLRVYEKQVGKSYTLCSYFVSNASLCVCIIFLRPTSMQYKILIFDILLTMAWSFFFVKCSC